jgi:hypothetical protein
MNTNKNRNLAKGFMPVLLLSAALSLPAASMAAPSPNGKAHAADKANKNHKQKARQHAQQAQKQAAKAEQHAQKAQRQAAKAQKNQKVVVVPQRVVRERVAQQRVVVPQRRVVVQQPVVVERPVYVAQRNNRNRARSWDGWNRRYGKYGSGAFQLDGTVADQQHGCVLVRDHQGQVIPLVGNPGDLRRGEHVLFSGRIQNGTVCGTAFRVDSVERVWADGNHRRVLFDRRYDGEYYDRSGGRYSQDRYDDRRYDDRYDDRYNRDGYDPDGRRAISIDGRLDDSGDCPVIRGDRGEYYDLVGDLTRFQDGRHVRVIGRDGIRSSCGGQAIEVGEIIYR